MQPHRNERRFGSILAMAMALLMLAAVFATTALAGLTITSSPANLAPNAVFQTSSCTLTSVR